MAAEVDRQTSRQTLQVCAWGGDLWMAVEVDRQTDKQANAASVGDVQFIPGTYAWHRRMGTKCHILHTKKDELYSLAGVMAR
jgi:hypothetical protein